MKGPPPWLMVMSNVGTTVPNQYCRKEVGLCMSALTNHSCEYIAHVVISQYN